LRANAEGTGAATPQDERDERLRRRVRGVLRPGEEIEHALVMSTRAHTVAAVRRHALVVTRTGAIVVCRLTAFNKVEPMQRFETTAAITATNVAPGECFVDVAGQRYWVDRAWTYALFRLASSGREITECPAS
jgi:hypothetical protein